MNPIRIGESNYNSPYGKEKLQARTENFSTGSQGEVKKDSFNPKYKSKNNTAGTIATIGVIVASAFAVFKGKGKIKDVLGGLNQNKGEFFKGIKEKLPKLSGLKESCKTHLKSGSESLKKPLNSIGTFISNIVKKRK